MKYNICSSVKQVRQGDKMKLKNLENRTKKGYTTFGCIWEKGQYKDATAFRLISDKQTLPMDTKVTAFWPDKSIKWTKHTADATNLSDTIEVLAVEGEKSSTIEGIKIEETKEEISIDTNKILMKITKHSDKIFDEIYVDGKLTLLNGQSTLILEEPAQMNGYNARFDKTYRSKIENCSIEQGGDLQVIVRYEGIHINATDQKIPFIIRLKVGLNSEKIDMTYTFLYDGDEDKDFLKGLGVTFDKPMQSPMYNRHIKMETDFGTFHESVVPLVSWRPPIAKKVYEAQMDGENIDFPMEQQADIDFIMNNTPYWSEFDLCQSSHNSFLIKKKLFGENLCYIDSLRGTQTKGTIAFGDENGSVILGTRDFWEKYPSGYTIKDLDQDLANATMWIWSPQAQPMDFRHYANRGYNAVCYEGYDFKGATPYGIGSTSEFSIIFDSNIIPSDEKLIDFSRQINQPPVYVGKPEYYHQLKAFGHWSMVKKETPMEVWIEEQLDRAVDFYLNEVKQRHWYGLFNYGDFMHTYDAPRHQWRYDIGGYAWDNTELVPTLWLWLMFMRTGREDIFTLAEKLSRHTSEVDVYHMGQLKGLGSRHNVRHWGCPCKEARIAMAGHHRFYYYMTGDSRLEDIFDELKDNELTFLNKDPLEAFYDQDKMVYKAHARSGPDWSSLCSNWMTQWERFNDSRYRDKIKTGIEDIKKAPLQLMSGPDFEFDPYTNHLRYIGEKTTGGIHLQICMGAPQIWFELALLLDDREWTKMLADYGRFYFLDHETQMEESHGIIGDRIFSYPFMAATMGAFGADYFKDEALGKKVWATLLNSLVGYDNFDGFKTHRSINKGNHQELVEIPWISTNFVAQWCLNMIMCLEFIGEHLPKDFEATTAIINDLDYDGFRDA